MCELIQASAKELPPVNINHADTWISGVGVLFFRDLFYKNDPVFSS